MNNLKTNPKGIDFPIQRTQIYLFDKLTASLGVEIDGYGRAYVDEEQDSIMPRAYLGDGEYKELLIDDTIKGLHFFFVEKNAEVLANTGLSSNEVDLIVIIDDLRKVRTDVDHYADEEIKEEVKCIVKQFWEMESVTKGEPALEGFDTSKLKFIYPYYVFKITGTYNNY